MAKDVDKGKSFWNESRNTVKGSAIITAIGLISYGIKKLVNQMCKKKDREAAKSDEKEMIRFRNQEELKRFEEELKLRLQYSVRPNAVQCPVFTDENWKPLTPRVYNPFKPIESNKDSRLFASVIHKGDVGIVIAAKGVGKTTLFMQIGNCIAQGKPTGLWPKFDEGEHKPQRVLYYDGELVDKDMQDRYYQHCFEFDDNFERYDRTQIRSIEDVLNDLEGKVANGSITGDATVIIDNVTKLLETSQIDKIKKFNDSIDRIHADAERKGIKLTVISIIHLLGKEYSEGTPIRLKNAAGGSDLTNYANFVMALEQPKNEKGVLLVKVLNARGEPEPDEVCVLLRKDGPPCLHFEYCGEMDEEAALSGTGKLTQQPKQSKAERAAEVKAKIDGGKTHDEVAAEYGVSRQTIYNWLKDL